MYIVKAATEKVGVRSEGFCRCHARDHAVHGDYPGILMT
jgi:hypothetical protein